jgi:hypothetical protein
VERKRLHDLLPQARPEQLGRDHDPGSASRHHPTASAAATRFPPAAAAGWTQRASLAGT